jgi:hypothetical protein
LALGPSEAATFWLGFLRELQQRGLAGVKLVISDSHEGLKAAIAQVFTASWQRCRVHFVNGTLKLTQVCRCRQLELDPPGLCSLLPLAETTNKGVKSFPRSYPGFSMA